MGAESGALRQEDCKHGHERKCKPPDEERSP